MAGYGDFMVHTSRQASEGASPQEWDIAPQDTALVARQPIFDVLNNVPAYELLFRDPAMQPGLGGKHPTAATATVLVDGFELIRPTLRPGQRLFINFTAEALEAELATLLPPEICAVEILESVRPTPAVLQGVQNLKRQGYRLALDDYSGQQELAAFLDLVDIVKVGVTGKNEEDLRRLIQTLRPYKVALLAEKVEDHETMRLCRELRFALFQGFFFGRAEIVKGKKLSASQAAKFRLLGLSGEEDKLNALADAIMADVFLAYKLLRYINSVYFGMSKKVKSIRQAILLLGRRKFNQWLCVTTLAELDDTAPIAREMAYTSALRGKFLEILARRSEEARARRAHAAMPEQGMGASLFLLGLFSMLESLLGIPMEEVLKELPMEEAIVEALTRGTGPYALWLDLTRAYECGEWDRVDQLASGLGQSAAALKASYTEAALWASEIFSSNQQQPPPVNGVKFSLVRNGPS
jgi:EAL and modified HD-GYP domain-containing signal transduction protein